MFFDRPGNRRTTLGSLTLGLHLLGLGLVATLGAPGTARAGEPAPPATVQPAPAPASTQAPAQASTQAPDQAPTQAPAQAPTPAPEAVSPQAASVPASVLAMKDRNVVLRTKGGEAVVGRLLAADDEGFTVQKADGATVRVARKEARGIRLAATDFVAQPFMLAPETGQPGDSSSDLTDVINSPPRPRVFGFGTAVGGGVSAAQASRGGKSLVAPELLGPSIEMQIFLPHEYSLDLSMPVVNMIIASVALKGAFVKMDLFFNANIGTGKTRFVFGPGIGFAYLSAQSDKVTSLRIPAQIGFEVLNKKRSFGFKMLARPYVELAYGNNADAVGGGVLGAFVFSGYARAPSSGGYEP